MSAPTPIFRSSGARAFTLIELLVSMVVLTLLLVLVVQMVNSALAVTNNSTRHMTADGQARGAFDRMAADFAQIVKRPDVDYFFKKNGSTTAGMDDQMAFYSETSGYYPSAPVPTAVQKGNASLVGYCIRKNTAAQPNDPTYGKRQLVRLSKALLWNGVGTTPPAMTYLPQTFPSVWPQVFPPGGSGALSTAGDMSDPTVATDADFQVIGDQVFRMEICYLVHYAATPATGTTSATAATTRLSDVPYNPASTATTAAGSTTPTPATLPMAYNGLRDVVAVVVSLAVLDDVSRVIVKPADLDAAASKLDYVGASPSTGAALANTPAKLWQAHLDKNELSNKNGGSLPPAAASQVRVYERYFYLGNAQ